MANFAYIKENRVVSIVVAETIEELVPLDKKYENIIELTGFNPEPQVGWYFQDNKFKIPAEGIDPLNLQTSKITKLAFLNRFTNQELAAYEAALTVSIPLKILDKKLFASTYVDLARPDTISGIQALAASGIISVGRANEILNTIPTDIEIYKG